MPEVTPANLQPARLQRGLDTLSDLFELLYAKRCEIGFKSASFRKIGCYSGEKLKYLEFCRDFERVVGDNIRRTKILALENVKMLDQLMLKCEIVVSTVGMFLRERG